SPTSASDISPRIRSSAGCVTTYSDLIDNIFAIFTARAGRYSCMAMTLYGLAAWPVVVRFFFAVRRGGCFGFRFRICLSARCGLRLGEGQRALGFSVTKEKLNHQIGNCEQAFLHNW